MPPLKRLYRMLMVAERTVSLHLQSDHSHSWRSLHLANVGPLHWGCMSIRENLDRAHEMIAAACLRAGRRTEEVRLMAVSKVHPIEMLLEAWSAGQRLFGENRVQEFAAKAEQLKNVGEAASLEVHLIGPLQNNKTARAAELFAAVDTIDSLKTGQRLSSAAMALGRNLPVLVEVKLSHEETKHGVAPELLGQLLDGLAGLPGLTVRGLMTVPPWSAEGEQARPYFRELRRLRDQSQAKYQGITELSMGMSNDFDVAIEEGSTTVRLGTAIFGRRPTPERS